MIGTMNRRLLMVTLALSAATLACAATYVVDGTQGDDANDGVNAPFRTIARGLALLRPGDTLRIVPMDQPYPESLQVRGSGTAQAPITIDGGGATVTGADPLPATGWEQQGAVFSITVPGSSDRAWLFSPGRHYDAGKTPEGLQPEQFCYAGGKLHFRPAEGKTPADYDLRAGVRSVGVGFNGGGQVIIRNLTCMNFWNDGFNIHGGTGPLWFENITGVWNGDEGFSAHENSECYVRGGTFNNNYWHGICDIQLTRTHFANCTIRDNRSKGVYFTGGMHSLTDCQISGSPINVMLSPTSDREYPRLDKHPLATSVTNFRSCVIESSPTEIGVQIASGAEGIFEHCVITGGSTVVRVDAGGLGLIANSVIAGGQTAEVSADGEYYGDYNIYHPGRWTIAGTSYGPEQFAAYQAATGNDAKSWVEEPKFVQGTWFTSRASHGFGGAHSRVFGGPNIGLDPLGYDPQEGMAVVPADAVALEGGGAKFTYDFETENPWSRIYPEPEKSQAGAAVEGTAELSDEQAHSGAKSMKLMVKAPEGPPAGYNVKLFSLKLAYERPVVGLNFWLYGDESGRRIITRVRDRSGECFYDAPFVVDWSGWKQVTWSLLERAPASIGAGDGNQRQDGPPMELVAEIKMNAGEEMVLFFDDLEVELAGAGGTAAITPPPTAPTTPAAPPPATTTAAAGGVVEYDFETVNPWGRTYPEPEKSAAGEAVVSSSELSDEQAHSGAKSAKVVMTVPAGAPASYNLKLFSDFLRLDGPVQAFSFWIYYTGEPAAGTLRVRDAKGEGFYGPTRRLTGQGWQQISWDLTREPPDRIAGGDNNKVQDFPPVELVWTMTIKPATFGRTLTYYVDDLQIVLAGEGTAAAPVTPAVVTPPVTPTAGAPASAAEATNQPDPNAAPPAPTQTEQLANGRTRYAWDFEQAHAWNRIYPVPETSQAGQFVTGEWSVSEEQAHEGNGSGEVLVNLPAGGPGNYTIKLFSPKFTFDKPIRALRFWVYYAGQPIPYDLRVRDARGEGFFAPDGAIAGTGWQQIEWDLERTPPVRHSGGNNDGIIDCPPQELVIELKLSQNRHGSEVVIYLDGLQIETGG